MTNDTEVLPTDRRLLEQWMPDEPPTSVTRTRTAVATIKQAIADTRTTHDQLVVDQRNQAHAIVDAATVGDNLEPLIAALGNGHELHTAAHQLAQLQTARRIAERRITAAERTDPGYQAWRQACDRIVSDWAEAMAADDKANALVAFARLHRRR